MDVRVMDRFAKLEKELLPQKMQHEQCTGCSIDYKFNITRTTINMHTFNKYNQ
jgi:hypothetical protein